MTLAQSFLSLPFQVREEYRILLSLNVLSQRNKTQGSELPSFPPSFLHLSTLSRVRICCVSFSSMLSHSSYIHVNLYTIYSFNVFPKFTKMVLNKVYVFLCQLFYLILFSRFVYICYM